MVSTVTKRAWYKAYECDPSKMVTHSFPGEGKVWSLLVADVTVPAWQVFTDLMTKHDYLFRETAGGTYNCRNIAGTELKSLHSYGIALDLNPSKNPFGTTKTDMPKAFTDAVLATDLFRWGMDFKDPMHWEIDVPPDYFEEDDDVTPEQDQMLKDIHEVIGISRVTLGAVENVAVLRHTESNLSHYLRRVLPGATASLVQVDVDPDDIQALAAAIADSLNDELAQAVADELAVRLAE